MANSHDYQIKWILWILFFYCRSFWLASWLFPAFILGPSVHKTFCLVSKVTHLLKICKVTFGYNQRKKKTGDEAFRINRSMVQMIRTDLCLLYRVGIGQWRISWLYNLTYDHHILITTCGKWFDDDKCISVKNNLLS